ncbi:CoA activase [bacterium]|nr:CoA activase [bacterium]
MKYFVGIDIGSTSIKVVIIDDSKNVIAKGTTATGHHFNENTEEVLNSLFKQEGINEDDIAYMVSTGYGRKLYKRSNENVNELSANVAGAVSMGNNGVPIRTIINVGGQDTKVISVSEKGEMQNFVMNDKCAAGTGRFLEMTARNLEIDLEELGSSHLNAQGAPVAINSTCTVFAESEIISLLANGHGKGEMIAGIHYSISKRIVRLAERIGIDDTVFFDGGAAMNKGLVSALNSELMREVVVPKIPQITTALGAALVAKEAFNTQGE